MKTDMNVTRECSLQLICNLFPVFETCESNIMELYTPLFSSENPQNRIIASRFLSVSVLIFRRFCAILKEKKNSPKYLRKSLVKEVNYKKYLPLKLLLNFMKLITTFHLQNSNICLSSTLGESISRSQNLLLN